MRMFRILIALCLVIVNLSFAINRKGQNGYVQIYADSPTSGITISANGYVGIGVVSPIAKLDVQGTINAVAFSGDGKQITNVVSADHLTNPLISQFTNDSNYLEISRGATQNIANNDVIMTGKYLYKVLTSQATVTAGGIANGLIDGQLLVLINGNLTSPYAQITIPLTNVFLLGNAAYRLKTRSSMMLIWSASLYRWVQVSGSVN